MTGVGVQAGSLRGDWGPDYADLQCDACDAGWVGPLGEECVWCLRRVASMRVDQAHLLLHPDLPDVDDVRFAAVVEVWQGRLTRGIAAGIITRAQASRAWSRHVISPAA